MALETGNFINDLVITNPVGSTDQRRTLDDHIRLIKKTLKQTLVGFSGAVVVSGTDGGAADAYTVTPTTALPSYAANMCVIFTPTSNNTGASTINVSGLGAKDIKSVDGVALVASDLVAGSIYVAIYNGTEFRLIAPTKNYADQLAFGTALPNQTGNDGKSIVTAAGVASWGVSGVAGGGTGINSYTIGDILYASGATTLSKLAASTVNYALVSGGAGVAPSWGVLPIAGGGTGQTTAIAALNALHSKGSNIASAATINLDTATGDFVHVTGATAITAITLASGNERTVVFDGALTLTHNATTLILPSGANITTAAGDRATFRGDGSGNVRCIHYTKASGQAVVSPSPGMNLLSTVAASASSTVDVETTFDSTYDVYVIVASGVTVSANNTTLNCLLKVGGAYATAGYIQALDYTGNNSGTTGNFSSVASSAPAAALSLSGSGELDSAAYASCDFVMYIFNPASTAFYKNVMWEGVTVNDFTSGGIAKMHGVGQVRSASALTGVRFQPSTGNFPAGTFRLYGIRN